MIFLCKSSRKNAIMIGKKNLVLQLTNLRMLTSVIHV
jgi:hypothetical protein